MCVVSCPPMGLQSLGRLEYRSERESLLLPGGELRNRLHRIEPVWSRKNGRSAVGHFQMSWNCSADCCGSRRTCHGKQPGITPEVTSGTDSIVKVNVCWKRLWVWSLLNCFKEPGAHEHHALFLLRDAEHLQHTSWAYAVSIVLQAEPSGTTAYRQLGTFWRKLYILTYKIVQESSHPTIWNGSHLNFPRFWRISRSEPWS